MSETVSFDNLFSIRGKVALVTGGSRGIGEMIAAGFLAQGAKVYISSRKAEVCDATAKRLAETYGGECISLPADLSKMEGVGALAKELAGRESRLDILINNAGVSSFAPLDAEDEYEAIWHRAMAVMLTAHQRMVRAALPFLRQSDAARIVNIASTEGLGATPGDTPYVAAKTGVTGLTRGLAVDLGKEGITVNCVCPGPILTGMTARIAEEDKAVFAKRRTALRRYGLPEEVAQMTLNLVLPASSFVTGAVIPVDGGLIARNA